MKKVTLFLMLAFCMALAGCSKDAEVEAFITEFDATTNEMVGKIDASPDGDGVDAAQKSFDAKKEGLKTKWNAIKDARDAQVSEAVKKKMDASMEKNMKAIIDTASKNAVGIAGSPGGSDKFKKLMEDYGNTFK